MKWFTITTPGLVFRYTTEYVLSPIGKRYLGAADHPIRPKIEYMFETRERKRLWWRISVSKIGSLKRVVRSWSARRARIAFKQSLRDEGYDESGFPLPGSPKNRTRRFMGTLEISCLPTSVTQSFEALQRDTDHSLKAILKRQGLISKHEANDFQKKPGPGGR